MLALAACQALKPPASQPRQPVTPAPTGPPVAGATLLHIEAGASLLELRVRAAGPLAPLGHAHVLRATQLEGELWLAEPLEHSRLQLRVPVESISVDDPQARAAAGGEFARPLPEEARRGTREHLLGERQLDAAHFPRILLEAESLQVARGDVGAGEGSLALRVTLRDRSTMLAVPVAWEQVAGEQVAGEQVAGEHGARGLRARGQFTLSQSALGIEPYNVGGGALRVADEVAVRFDIVAR